MKVVVWQGCRVIDEREYPGEGPDIHLDPTNLPNAVSVRRNTPVGFFHESVDISSVAMPELKESL